MLLLLAMVGCADPPAPDPAAYATALTAVQADPAGTAAACASVVDPTLHADCVSAGAEALAGRDVAAAAALCAGLPAGLGRDECFFQVAERGRDPTRCADAGRFADDCRLHLWSTGLSKLIPRGAGPGGFEATAAEALARYGFDEDDPRPWSAAYRWVLGGQRPLDRGSCDAAPTPAQVEACKATALALYSDLLNHARDTHTFPCDGGPLPERLATLPDTEIDALLARRRAADLCP